MSARRAPTGLPLVPATGLTLSLHSLILLFVGPRPKRVTPVVQLTLPTNLVIAVDSWARREGQRRHGARVTRSQAVRELLTFALSVKHPVRVHRLGDEPRIDEESARMTPSERVELISDLTREAYELRGDDVSGIRRDLVRIGRRGR